MAWINGDSEEDYPNGYVGPLVNLIVVKHGIIIG